MSTFEKAKAVMLPTNESSKIENLVTYQKRNLAKVIKEGINPKDSTVQFWNLYIISDDEIKKGDYVYVACSEVNVYEIRQITEYYNGQFLFNDKSQIDMNYCKKIIATTDVSLGLPQPSQQFIQKYIEEYNKGNIITDVLVEYETLYDIELLVDTEDFKKGSYIRGRCSNKKDFSRAKNRFLELHTDGNYYNIARDSNKIRTLYKQYFKDVEFTNIKINPKDNTITIKKVKDSYTREEVEKLCKKAYREGQNYDAPDQCIMSDKISIEEFIRQNL